MSRAVILSGVRTPIGRKDGALSGVRPDDLAATVIAEAVARAGVPSEQIEDVYFGAANQAGEDNRNVARMAALLSGENVAERWQISREEQDAFGLRSQQRWAAAAEAGRFDDELVTVNGVERDEHPRPDTTAGKLAALKPAFREDGTVTAGNASGINDGAAALVIASEEKAQELGVEPLGHPLGMSGARLVVSLLHELRRRRGRLGIAALCVGVGQGQAALFERVS